MTTDRQPRAWRIQPTSIECNRPNRFTEVRLEMRWIVPDRDDAMKIQRRLWDIAVEAEQLIIERMAGTP